MSLAARFGPLRPIQTKPLWRELLSATAHFGFWINPSLLRPSWPCQRKSALKWAPFGFQCCFIVNKGRILSQMIGQYQKPKSTIVNSTGLSKVVLSKLPSVAQICSLKYTFVCSYQLTNIYPVGSLTRQYTGPGWQLNSPTECFTIVKARALCHPLAKPGAVLSRQLW